MMMMAMVMLMARTWLYKMFDWISTFSPPPFRLQTLIAITLSISLILMCSFALALMTAYKTCCCGLVSTRSSCAYQMVIKCQPLLGKSYSFNTLRFYSFQFLLLLVSGFWFFVFIFFFLGTRFGVFVIKATKNFKKFAAKQKKKILKSNRTQCLSVEVIFDGLLQHHIHTNTHTQKWKLFLN